MSINYNNVQVTSFNGGSSTTTSTANPVTGTVAGDLLIMYAVITYNSGLTPTITPPTGWTPVVEDETNTSYTPTYLVAYKIATGSDDYTISYTSTTGRREIFVMKFSGDYNLANLVTAGAKVSGSATSFTAPSVTAVADNSMLLSFCATKAGTVSADDLAVPPTGMTLLKSSNVADVSNQMAVAYQNAIPTGATGTKTWASFIASANYGNTVNVLINGLAVTIDTINGDASNPDIDVTASNTATTTGLGTITATTFTDASGFVSTATPTMTSGDGSFVFAWPWADGSQQAKFGSVTASMTDGTLTATLPSTMSLPSTYSSTTWSGATDLGEFYLGHYLTLTNDNRVYYQTIIDGITVTINADGWMSFSDLPVTVPLLLHDCRSGGTGLITTKTLIVTESGAVVATGGLTSSGLTSSGLTASGLTSSGL